jgi:signal transduction histidine kinase
MSRTFRYRSVRVLVAIAAIVLTGSRSQAWNAPDDDRQKQVLVIYSTRRDAQIVVVGDRELQQIFDDAVPGGVDYYSEALDQTRFRHPEFATAFRDSLQLKYQLQHFDVIIAIGAGPLAFLEGVRDTLFPGVPVVFFSETSPPRHIPNATGLVAPVNFFGTVELMTQLQPDLQHLFVIDGARSIYTSLVREQLAPYGSRLDVTFFSGLPSDELERRLATLPKQSAVYYVSVERDSTDQNFRPLDYLDRVSTVASAPVYCWVDSAIDHGVVGGSLKSQELEARTIGTLALRVLRGERADSIHLSSADLNVAQVDWRQLRRWNIPASRVPKGTVIKFRDPSAWDRYRGYILAALAALLAQTALIAGLLVQRARRRQAEAQARQSEAALRASYQRIRDLGGRILHAQETERARIARELHDDIGQQVALLQIDLDLMGRTPEAAASMVGKVVDRGHSIGKSMHDLSHQLHPTKLRLIGLKASLESLRQELASSGVTIALTLDDLPASLTSEITLCIYRVVQEGIQNAMKHSGARTISVRVRGGDPLTATIEDDGKGFDVQGAWGKGLGLISMQERVETLSGTFEVRSTPEGGTRVEVKVPLHATAATTVAV